MWKKLSLNNLKSVLKFIKYVWKINPKILIANIIFRLAQTVIPVLLLYVVKMLVDLVVLYAKTGKREDYSEIIGLILVELGLAILSNLLARGMEFTDYVLADLVTHRTSVDIIKKCSELDLEQFQDSAFQDKLNQARSQMQSREYLISEALYLIQSIINVLFLSITLISYNFWYIFILAISIIPSSLGDNYINKLYYKLNLSQTSKRRELDYVCYLGASSDTAKEVKAYSLYDYFINRFQYVSKKLFLSKLTIHILRMKLSSIYFSASTMGYYSIYGIILLDVAKGNITVGDLSLITGIFFRVCGALEAVSRGYIKISQGAMHLENLFNFFEIKFSLKKSATPIPFPKIIKSGFEFRNVGFKYHNTDKWVLRNINLKIEVGYKTALVGENGSGKSTIIRLISRLYDPSEGQILLDNVDIRDYDAEQYRAGITILFQDFMRYNLPVNRNISLGNVKKLDDKKSIVNAAKLSLIDDLIVQFPDGYNQMLGKMFDGGTDLSGGQWQKIAFARAYMRDSQVFILDEPTSALDAQSEEDIISIFNEHVKQKISIIVSHKFSIIRKADNIIIIDKGAIKETGTHEQLINGDSIYAQLYNLQAKGYIIDEQTNCSEEDEFQALEELVF
ncbi:MAG: ABC transporter ATP-binding protein/permease [Arcicella sp.]|nr:ABC transporter ATP-binding protein/permease [Arcicella sp.]